MIYFKSLKIKTLAHTHTCQITNDRTKYRHNGQYTSPVVKLWFDAIDAIKRVINEKTPKWRVVNVIKYNIWIKLIWSFLFFIFWTHKFMLRRSVTQSPEMTIFIYEFMAWNDQHQRQKKIIIELSNKIWWTINTRTMWWKLTVIKQYTQIELISVNQFGMESK